MRPGAPARCAVVEDSLPGMVAGLSAGMQVYAAPSRELQPAQLDARVRPIGSLADLLCELWHLARCGRLPEPALHSHANGRGRGYNAAAAPP